MPDQETPLPASRDDLLRAGKVHRAGRSRRGRVNVIRAVDWTVNHLEGDLVFVVKRDIPALLRRDRRGWIFLDAAGPPAPNLPLHERKTLPGTDPGQQPR
jgi:hypothetical protein